MLAKDIEKIRSKEKGAGDQVREARVKAEEIIAKAVRDGEARIEDVIKERDEERRLIVKRAGEKAENEIKALRNENRKMIEALEEGVNKNHDEAIDIILNDFRG
ncbi:hypothetical protein J7M07_05220 [bacterium]|nr:hypothetical protein [bacterium]